jgi:hypothetical protein
MQSTFPGLASVLATQKKPTASIIVCTGRLVRFARRGLRSRSGTARRTLAAFHFLEFALKKGEGEQKTSTEEGKDRHVNSCNAVQEARQSENQETRTKGNSMTPPPGSMT